VRISVESGPRKKRAVITPEIKAQLLRLAGTKTDREVAVEVGLQPSNVTMFRQKNDIAPMYPSVKLTDEQWREIEPLLGKVRDNEIAVKYRVSNTTISSKRVSLGIPRMARCGEAAVTRDLEKIKRLRESGLTLEQIGRAYRVSRQRIEQLLKDL